MLIQKKKKSGFTLVELLILIAILAVLSVISIPKFNAWVPGYRLKSAASDLQSNLQKARVLAIKKNTTVKIRFDNSNPQGFYYFDTISDDIYTTGEFRVDLLSYQSGVSFGSGNTSTNWSNKKIKSPVPKSNSQITYRTDGTSNPASVYLQNKNKDVCYAVTTSFTGTSKIRKYNGILPFNVNNWIY